MATPGDMAIGDDGVQYMYADDGRWYSAAKAKQKVSTADFAKRVVTQDIPRAFSGLADLVHAIPGGSGVGAGPDPNPSLTEAITPATESGIPESSLSTGQRLTRDVAVGVATAAPFLATGGAAAPILLGGAGGGFGGGAVREAGGGPLAQFGGALVGGGVAAMAPGAVSAATSAATSTGTSAERAAARTLASRVQDRSLATYGTELPPRAGADSLGAATGDLGIQTLERDLAASPVSQSGDTPAFGAKIAETRAAALARPTGQFKKFGGTGDPSVPQATLKADVDKAVAEVRATGIGTNPNTASAQVYDTIRKASDEVFAPIKDRLDEFGGQLEAAGIKFQPTQTRAALAEIKKNAVFQQLIDLKQEGEGQILGLLDDVVSRKTPAGKLLNASGNPIRPPGDTPMSFTEQDALRSYISQLKSSKNAGVRREAGRLDQALQGDLREAVKDSPAGTLQAKYRAALDEYHDAAVIYKRGVLDDVTNNAGSFKPETVLGRLWLNNTAKGGAGASARQLRAALNTPERVQATSDAIAAHAYYASADAQTGVVNQAKLAKYLRDHSEGLSVFPEAQAKVSHALRLTRAAEDLGIKGNGAAIERASFAKFASDPDAAIRDILALRGAERAQAVGKYMGRLNGDANGIAGFRRILWEHMSAPAAIDEGGSVALSPERLRSVISDNESTFRIAWGNDSLPILRGIADEYERAASIVNPSSVRPVQVDTGIGRMVHSGIRLLANRIVGAPIQALRAGEIVQGAIRQKTALEAQRILESAIIDPYGKGRALLKKVVPQNEHSILAALGVRQSAASTASTFTSKENTQ